MGIKFSPNGFFITIADTAANLETLATTPTPRHGQQWSGEAVLSADGTVTVAAATAISQLAGFNVGTHQLTIGDSATNLLGAPSWVLALAYAVQLSQASTVTAADAVTLEAMHNFSDQRLPDHRRHPCGSRRDVGCRRGAGEQCDAGRGSTQGGNMSDYAIDAAQFAAMMALPHFSLNSFAGTVAVTDTAATLAGMISSLDGLSPATLTHIMTSLSASATVSVATAEALSALPGFSLGTSALTISDTVTNLATLDPGTAALASAIEVSTPVTMDAATAADLAALHNFTPDVNPITIADTPANLATLSDGATAIAATVTILPYSAPSAADYTLDVSQFLALIGKPVSFAGFAGPLHVLDTATDLAELAGSFIGAGPGSAVAQSRPVLTTLLSVGATVDADVMGYLVGLPGFSLNSHTLVLQDTPSNLIAAFSGFVPYASEVELAANGTPWVVTAAQAAQLAAIGPLNAGPAGMVVSDTVTNLLTAPYATGIDAGTATTLDQNSVVTVSQAEALHALPDFGRGGYTLIISDTAGNIATLDPGTAALATSIDTIGGSSSLSVVAFNAMVEASGFSGSPGSLTVADTAAALLTLVGSSNLTYVGTTVPECQHHDVRSRRGTAEHAAEPAGRDPPDSLRHRGQPTARDRRRLDAGRLGRRACRQRRHIVRRRHRHRRTGGPTGIARQPELSVGSYTITVADSAANLLSQINAPGLAWPASCVCPAMNPPCPQGPRRNSRR